MYDQPRKGTEAHAVQQEVERRKKLAKTKELDKLLSDLYHKTLRLYPARFKNARNKLWVYPEVSSAEELTGKEKGVQFVFGNKAYRITEESWNAWIGDDRYNNLALFLNDQKVFAVTENITSDEWDTYYSPGNVTAYVNEDWVSDFKNIQEYEKRKEHETAISRAEDPEKTQKLKEDFGITEVQIASPEKPGIPSPKTEAKGSSKKFWIWVIVIIVLLVWISNS